MKLETVKKILNEKGLSAKKKFGQNFLLDDNVLNNIVKGSNINKDINVIEIGPGMGFLTNYLSKHAKKVLCYEIDIDMVNILKENDYDNVEIIFDDFLNRNLDEDINNYFDEGDIYIVANLPYYITTPILLKVLEETNKVSKMVVMMQKEVALRLAGKPSTKDYNALSVLMQYFANTKILFNVSPKSFYPEPGVESSVIVIEYKDKIEYEAINLEYFLRFNRSIFTQRRKTLLNNIMSCYQYNKEQVVNVLLREGISPTIRSEVLSVNAIVELANAFYEVFEK